MSAYPIGTLVMVVDVPESIEQWLGRQLNGMTGTVTGYADGRCSCGGLAHRLNALFPDEDMCQHYLRPLSPPPSDPIDEALPTDHPVRVTA